jgi:hypothetical protein
MGESKSKENKKKESENIGLMEKRKRLINGAVMLLLSVGLFNWLLWTDANVWHRLWLFIPLWMGNIGLLQAREKT